MSDGPRRWERACLALDLLCADPGRLKGIVVRARHGPARDAFLRRLSRLPLPLRKVHPGVSDEQVFGGLDLAATLGTGKVVHTGGLAAAPCAIVLTMGERCTNELAARLAHLLDRDDGHCLIVLDESVEDGEGCPAPLVERLAFCVDLDGLEMADCGETVSFLAAHDAQVETSEAIGPLTALAARFGIDSMRAPFLALTCATLLAGRDGQSEVGETHASLAAELVYPHRATMMPEDEETENTPPEQPPEDRAEDTGEQGQNDELLLPDELIVDAMKALLPEGFLEQLAVGKTPGAKGASGAGTRKKGNRRGRPKPSRPGRLDGRSRIDLVATLRAAAPWQTIRAKSSPNRSGLHIRPSDIRVKQFEERSDRLLIFAVDASGSAAMARLGEAKGAVELLLAEAYARRDHVALVAFRGEDAELLLPPTRSLVQTKRRLAGLPGGGGTPLAAGLQAALDLGLQSRGKGLSPTVAVLTDGRANIALDGSANRAQAGQDAETVGRVLRAQDMPSILLDTGNRPARALKQLADTMDAPYVPLPRADAHRISSAVSDALA